MPPFISSGRILPALHPTACSRSAPDHLGQEVRATGAAGNGVIVCIQGWQPSIASRITAFNCPAAYHHPPASKSGFAVVVAVVVVTHQVGVQQLRLVAETPPQVA